MMSVKFRRGLAAALFVSLIFLSACAPSAPNGPAPTATVTAQSAEKTVITLWHSFTKDQQQTLNDIAADFNAKSEEYIVKPEFQPANGLNNKVLSAVSAGQGPDLFISFASEAANYIDAENLGESLVVDLSQYFNDPETGVPGFAESIKPSVYGEATSFLGGGMYILPIMRTGPILYYNKTLFDELELAVPKTWEEVADTARTIKEQKNIYGFATDVVTDMMQAMIMQKGSEYIDLDAREVKIDTQTAIDAASWYGGNVRAGYFMAAPTADYFCDDMNNKVLGMYIGSCASIPYLYPEQNGWELSVAVTPTWAETTAPWYPAWSRGVMMFATDEKKQRGGYEFLKFFIEPENNLKWCQSVICLSPFNATEALPGYQTLIDQNPALQALNQCLPNAGFLPSVKGASVLRSELEKAAVRAGDVSAKETAQELIAGALKTADEALKAE